MKTTIELTASQCLLEATTNILQAAKLLNNSINNNSGESNILTDEDNKACGLLGSCDEKCSTKEIIEDAKKEESEAPEDTDTLALQSLRILAKEKCKTAGREAVKSLITNLGADHLESLEKSKYEDLFNQLQAL